MASGTFERPLPDPADESALLAPQLGLGGISGSAVFSFAANLTRYLVFPSGQKQGLLIIGSTSSFSAKWGLYMYYSSASGTISLQPVLAPTQTGLAVAGTSNTVVTIVNPGGALYGGAICIRGGSPTLETALPA